MFDQSSTLLVSHTIQYGTHPTGLIGHCTLSREHQLIQVIWFDGDIDDIMNVITCTLQIAIPATRPNNLEHPARHVPYAIGNL
jgi:hypothetical protein